MTGIKRSIPGSVYNAFVTNTASFAVAVIVLVAVVFLSAGEAAAAPAARTIAPRSTRVVGYFPLWVANTGYAADSIDFSAVNTVAHFSVVPRPDGSIQVPDWGPFPDPSLIETAHAAGASVVLAVGGDHPAATQGFVGMAASASARNTFVANLIGLVEQNGYDGVDLDWEFPVSSADRTNQVALVAAIRTALPAGKTLSLAAPATDFYAQWSDWQTLAPYVDWIGVMTYALASAASSANADHNAALYSDAAGQFSVDQSIQYYLWRGMPSEKILVGLPFFGQRYDGATDLHAPLSGKAGEPVPYTDVEGLAAQGWGIGQDQQAGVPYLISNVGAGVVSFDDPASIRLKCRYVHDHSLGGAMVWYLSEDSNGAGQPLLAASRDCR